MGCVLICWILENEYCKHFICFWIRTTLSGIRLRHVYNIICIHKRKSHLNCISCKIASIFGVFKFPIYHVNKEKCMQVIYLVNIKYWQYQTLSFVELANGTHYLNKYYRFWFFSCSFQLKVEKSKGKKILL